jgi:hypothetical protein
MIKFVGLAEKLHQNYYDSTFWIIHKFFLFVPPPSFNYNSCAPNTQL